jgi:hypothetical protein
MEGDKVEIVKDDDIAAGVYRVLQTDESLTRGPDAVGIRLDRDRNGSYGLWIYNKSVKSIVERDGKPFGVQPAAVTEPTKAAHDLAKVGDTVTVKGSSWVPDGDYKVREIGDEGNRLRVMDVARNWPMWIDDRHIVALVGTQTSASADTRPFHEQAEVGDTVTVKGSVDTDDGEYEVTRADGNNPEHRVQVNYPGNGRTWYIKNDAVVGVRKKGSADPVADTRPAWEQAKVGDTIRIENEYAVTDGEYVVVEVDQRNGMGRRLRVRGAGRNWIANTTVKAITKVA